VISCHVKFNTSAAEIKHHPDCKQALVVLTFAAPPMVAGSALRALRPPVDQAYRAVPWPLSTNFNESINGARYLDETGWVPDVRSALPAIVVLIEQLRTVLDGCCVIGTRLWAG